MVLAELIEAIGDSRVTPRFVRYLVSNGAIPPPDGGRANASYNEAHVAGIRNYLCLRDAGVSRDHAIQAGPGRYPITIELAPGLVLRVDGPPPADTITDLTSSFRAVLRSLPRPNRKP